MLFAGAAVLAGVHVLEVLLGTPLWRFAEVTTFVLLAAYAAARAEPRWLGPVVLSPLLLDALLTIPAAQPATYVWQVSTQVEDVNPWVDAIDQGFRQGGAMVLFVLALLVTRPIPQPRRPGARVAIAVLLGLAIAGYAGWRIVLGGSDPEAGRAVARGLAVLVPLGLVAGALVFVAVGRGWATALGGVLIVAATLPMIDAMIVTVETPYAAYVSSGPGLFGSAAITPTKAFPAPVAAIEEALLLAGVLALMARARFREAQFGKVQFGKVQFGKVQFGKAQFGKVRFRKPRFRQSGG
jgi:hypothetical protein